MSTKNRTRRVRQTAKPDGYVALATYCTGSDAVRLLAAKGRIVLFDTVAIAQQFIPLLGMGRTSFWSKDGESITWMPLDPNGFNRAVILTGYDPYHTPAGMPDDIRSEARGREWKSHVMFSAAFLDCGQMVRKADGTVVNTALER